jgi:glycosyltransferase involved in cell wall biosynthesis
MFEISIITLKYALIFIWQINDKEMELSIYDILGIVPDYISTYDSRKFAWPDLTQKNDKGKYVLFGGLPKDIDKKELIQWIEDEIIQYLGFVTDIRKVIASADCIVLPSYREAIARTITEGMAMGKPIITSQTAGCREAVQDGENGYLVEIKNSKALADTFLKFMSLLPEEKKLMGEIGRMKACNEFDDAIIADQINDIVYETLK